jgi:hypothetical protein
MVQFFYRPTPYVRISNSNLILIIPLRMFKFSLMLDCMRIDYEQICSVVTPSNAPQPAFSNTFMPLQDL